MNKKEIDYSWRLKTHKMTYILAGKLNGKVFIRVDKILNNNPNSAIQNKLFHSQSNPDIHLSLAGDKVLMDIIKEYDNKLLRRKKRLKINNTTFSYLGKRLAKQTKYKLGNNYVYIINGTDVLRYTLNLAAGKFINCSSIIIQEGEFLPLAFTDVEKIPYGETDGKTFSEKWIQWYYSKRVKEGYETHSVNSYFINGFNFHSN